MPPRWRKGLFPLPRGGPLGRLPLAGRGGLLGRTGSLRGRPARGCLAAARAADPAATFRGYVGVGNTAARAALVAAAGLLVDRRPGTPLGFLLGDAAILLALFDMFGLALLLVGVAGFVAARHDHLPRMMRVSNHRNARGAAGVP